MDHGHDADPIAAPVRIAICLIIVACVLIGLWFMLVP